MNVGRAALIPSVLGQPLSPIPASGGGTNAHSPTETTCVIPRACNIYAFEAWFLYTSNNQHRNGREVKIHAQISEVQEREHAAWKAPVKPRVVEPNLMVGSERRQQRARAGAGPSSATTAPRMLFLVRRRQGVNRGRRRSRHSPGRVTGGRRPPAG